MDKEETEYMLRWSEHNPQVMTTFYQVSSGISVTKLYHFPPALGAEPADRRDPRRGGEDVPGSQDAAVRLQPLLQTLVHQQPLQAPDRLLERCARAPHGPAVGVHVRWQDRCQAL